MERDVLEQLRTIATAQTLSAEDKQLVTDLSVEHGVEFKCTKCRNRYQDQAAILYNMLKPQEQTEGRYLLKDGVDVYFGAVRVNAATLTDELGDWLVSNGFDKHLFAKCNCD